MIHQQKAGGSDRQGRTTSPLLIIAGSGKTNTLAHRVAHLIAGGADPRLILLLTFSRRAAAEMTRRTERILAEAMRQSAAVMAEALSWAGTFHGIGARLLRDYAPDIGLDPSFTIHDREDSADLMNLVRHGLGFSKTEKRFPTKGACLAIYSRCINAELPIGEVLRTAFPWTASWAEALKELFAGYLEAKQRQCVLDYDDLLLYPSRQRFLTELIVRAGDFFGPRAGNNWFAQGLIKLGKPLAAISYPGAPGVGHQWAYLPNVAETMVRLINKEETLEPFATFHMEGHLDADGARMIAAIRQACGRPDLPVRRFP